MPAPVINSALMVGGTRDTPFIYQITATNTPVGFNATGLPAGLTVNTGNGLISGTPTVSGSFNVALTATNASGPGTATLVLTIGDLSDLGAALDTTGLTWTSGGNANWFGQTVTTHDNVDAAQSGDIDDGGESYLETTVTGPGTLTFWWKVSSQADSDFLIFDLDGDMHAAAPDISGEVNWQQVTVPVPGGSHTLSWTYYKDELESHSSDAGWLDGVVFTPGQPGGYTQWAIINIPAGQDATFNGDWNRDGIINGIAYVFGNTRLKATGKGKVPVPSALPAHVDIYLERSLTLGPPGWTPVTSWVNGPAPVLASGLSIVGGEVGDTFAGPVAFYRYRVVKR